MPKRILFEWTASAIAEHFGISKMTVIRWAENDRIPIPAKRGVKRVWTNEQVETIAELMTAPDLNTRR